MIARWRFISVGSAVVLISIMLGANGFPGLMAISAVSGAVFLFWKWRKPVLVSSAWLGLTCIVIIWVRGTDFPLWQQCIGLLAAIAAWDSNATYHRAYAAFGSGDEKAFVVQHLARTAWVLGLSALLMVPALSIKYKLCFWLAILLAVIVILGIGAAIRYVRR